MSDVVIGQLVEAQVEEMIEMDEVVEAVGGYDCHGRDVDLNSGACGGIDRIGQQVLNKDQAAGLSSERTSTDARKAKGTIPEVPVECRKIGRLRLGLDHDCLRPPNKEAATALIELWRLLY
jgi:hypothetical protein